MDVTNGTVGKYKECFVAFVDILGFSEMVNGDTNGENLALIKDAIALSLVGLRERQQATNGPYKFWFDEFVVKSFSDCFCFSIPLEFDNGEKDYKQNLVAFYVWLKVFYNVLLKKGFICRGGLSQGLHYWDGDIIFSKALVESYILESQRATYPIFMLHPNLVHEISKRYFTDEPYFAYMFSHDNSGRNFLNPFNYSIVDEMFFGPEYGTVRPKDINERRALIEMHLQTIERRIKELKGKNAVDKWQWLKEFALFVQNGTYKDKFENGLLF